MDRFIDSPYVHDEVRELGQMVRNSRRMDEEQLLHAVQTYGPSPGSKAMLANEESAAQFAIDSDTYITFTSLEKRATPGNPTADECFRLGPAHGCFCQHALSDHLTRDGRCMGPCRAAGCRCRAFWFIPSRPEEVGDSWLPRRPDFDLTAWGPMCVCGCPSFYHHPLTQRCEGPAAILRGGVADRRLGRAAKEGHAYGMTKHGCRGCGAFTPRFACVACDAKWSEHVVRIDGAAERRAEGRTVGEAYRPLAATPALRRVVFPPRGTRGGRSAPLSGGAAGGGRAPRRAAPAAADPDSDGVEDIGYGNGGGPYDDDDGGSGAPYSARPRPPLVRPRPQSGARAGVATGRPAAIGAGGGAFRPTGPPAGPPRARPPSATALGGRGRAVVDREPPMPLAPRQRALFRPDEPVDADDHSRAPAWPRVPSGSGGSSPPRAWVTRASVDEGYMDSPGAGRFGGSSAGPRGADRTEPRGGISLPPARRDW